MMMSPVNQWYDDDHDVIIVYITLPDGIDEMVTPNPDGTHTVFISTAISEERQREAYRHALEHVKMADFSRDDVQTIEYEAHCKTA